MARVTVDLQEGFDGQEVRITAGGQQLFRRVVTTRHQIGLAERLEFEPEGRDQLVLGVELVGEGGQVRVVLPAEGATHVGISVVDGRLEARVAKEPFQYA